MTGAIHDLGYKRYLGTRRPQSTRWRVIVRNQVGTGWKTWWRFKAAIGVAVIVMIVFAAFMYVRRFIPGRGDRLLVGPGESAYDGLLAMSMQWFCYAAFLVGLTVGSGTIAADRQVGAFTFYFARPVRPIDYVLGKFGGLFLLQLILIAAPTVALAAFRCGMVDNTDELIRTLPVLGKAALSGVLAAAVYAAVPLGLSSLVARRRNAVALWAVFYVLICNMLYVIGHSGSPWIGQFDLSSAVKSADSGILGVHVNPMFMSTGPLDASLVALAFYTIGGVALAWWQVSRDAIAGVGSG
jgi:ABC-2 type transport system permease protein